ncbi:MAG: hypothetical protein L6R28_11630 [Planctomycetes bacterium]|nr:hypothetical protein [Planctomycetota bacterium]
MRAYTPILAALILLTLAPACAPKCNAQEEQAKPNRENSEANFEQGVLIAAGSQVAFTLARDIDCSINHTDDLGFMPSVVASAGAAMIVAAMYWEPKTDAGQVARAVIFAYGGSFILAGALIHSAANATGHDPALEDLEREGSLGLALIACLASLALDTYLYATGFDRPPFITTAFTLFGSSLIVLPNLLPGTGPKLRALRRSFETVGLIFYATAFMSLTG